jgi:hypothetical protein
MTHQKSRADLALKVFDTLFHHNSSMEDNLHDCLSIAGGISEFTELACGNAAFRGDDLSLQALADTTRAAVNYLKVADVLVDQTRIMRVELERAIEEREQANHQAVMEVRK